MDPIRAPRLRPAAAAGALSWLCLAAPALAQDQASNVVYRCPGNPVLYTDALTAAQARERGCKAIESAPVTIVQGTKPRAAAATTPAPATASAPARSSAGQRVDPSDQRARDSDARRILSEELRREEAALADLQREYNGGQPERRGDERNFQKYLDRVAELKSAVARKEADVAAIKREIGKLPP